MIPRAVAILVCAVGLVLLLQVLVAAIAAGWPGGLPATALRLAVPFHVLSVGLVLQRASLGPRLAKAAWWLAVVSGLWLAAAIAIRASQAQ